MRTGSPGHLRSFDYVGFHSYFLTFCTYKRTKAFTSSDHVEIAWTQILQSSAVEAFAILAYCFMPDHLHLLVEAQSESSDALKFISRAKQLSGYHYKQMFGERLWQRYGFERVLRSDEQSLIVARYILENPLRRGLVQRVEDYPYLGSTIFKVSEILEAIQMS